MSGNLFRGLGVSSTFFAVVWFFAVATVYGNEADDLRETVRQLSIERDQLKAALAEAKNRNEQLQKEMAGTKVSGSAKTATQPSAEAVAGTAARKEWVVEVLLNAPFDTAAAEAEVHAAKTSLDSITERLKASRSQLSTLRPDSSTSWTRSSSSGRGGSSYTESHSSESPEYDLVKRQGDDLERKQTIARKNLTRAEGELLIKKNTRSIDAKLDDGAPVRITAGGEAAAVGATMKNGNKYRVTGIGTTSGGLLRIALRSAVPVGPAPK